MPVDPEEGLVTDFMLGMMMVFGADIIALVGLLWAAGFLSTSVFVSVTAVTVAVYAVWIGWRWWQIRTIEQRETADRTPLAELKRRYAEGELSDADFERKLDQLVEADERVDDETEPTLEK